MNYKLMVAVLLSVISIAVIALSVTGKSKFRQYVDRIVELRSGGSSGDGLAVLHDVKVSAEDYMLMGCDNACAERNHPEVSRDNISEGRWMAAGDDLPREAVGHNYHSTNGKVESFYNDCTKTQYQSSPEEVAWYYIRIMELRANKLSVDERQKIIRDEAKSKPWKKMQ